MRISPDSRVAILLHGGTTSLRGKTGLAMLRYSTATIVAAIDGDRPGEMIRDVTGIDREVPIVASVADALAFQPDILVIGIAPSGGALPTAWRADIATALQAGLSVANGLHTELAQDPEFAALLQPNRWIWDVRREPSGLSVGKGLARTLPCQRVLTVGTDMSIGKMSTSLELHRESQARGLTSRFVGTGQAGIFIAGGGIALDAVRVDFAAGGVEHAVLQQAQPCDIIHIEGQGSLIHPGSTATLPLIRGSQPTHMILVHRAGQAHVHSVPDIAIPPLPEVIQMYESIACAAGTFAKIQIVAIALNTRDLDDDSARCAIRDTEHLTQLPCTDAVRYGAAPLVDAILA